MADRPPRKKPKLSRRSFLRGSALFAGGVAAAAAGAIPIKFGDAAPLLRPPGAVPEDEFLASCIKCGQCIQVCPVLAILFADADRGFGIGTPYIDARDQACDFSCDALQCILACPTGALNHELEKPPEVRMGLAELTKPKQCLARKNEGFKGLARGADYEGMLRYEDIDRWKPLPVNEHPYDREVCDLCVIECPIEDAIVLEKKAGADGAVYHEPVVKEACTGCGVCEMICPVEEACIEVIPWKTWPGKGEA